MMRNKIIVTGLILWMFFSFHNVDGQIHSRVFESVEIGPGDIRCGAERMEECLPLLRGKSVAVLTNQSGLVGARHLVDTLLSVGVRVKKVMSPEHGFRGKAAAGEHVSSGIDLKTGLPVVSLYGAHRKPTRHDLEDVDVVLFDLQDVGARFYTYISTLHLVMEACAENSKLLLLLDRPNPNGFYVDGPMLDPRYSSFVGMDKLPVVHGLTMGELAMMINGEHWLKDSLQCPLKVVKVEGYRHELRYQLPIAPSPNLPNMSAVYLYPSLCFFEGTVVSVGRGTSKPFQLYGHPVMKTYDTLFTPHPLAAAPHPKWEGKTCKGYDLSDFGKDMMPYQSRLSLFWLIEAYYDLGGKADFFTPFFDKLAGTDRLRKQILAGATEEEIRQSWQAELRAYKLMRKKYLLYPDFE